MKSVFWPALVRNVIMWGLAQYINMSYVPIKASQLHTAIAMFYYFVISSIESCLETWWLSFGTFILLF